MLLILYNYCKCHVDWSRHIVPRGRMYLHSCIADLLYVGKGYIDQNNLPFPTYSISAADDFETSGEQK